MERLRRKLDTLFGEWPELHPEFTPSRADLDFGEILRLAKLRFPGFDPDRSYVVNCARKHMIFPWLDYEDTWPEVAGTGGMLFHWADQYTEPAFRQIKISPSCYSYVWMAYDSTIDILVYRAK